LENREHYFQLQQQQQTLGASTTTSTTSSTSTAKDAGLNLQIPQTKRILSLAEQCQIVELRKTSDITHKALAKQFGCGISKIRTTLNNSEYYLKLQLRRNETVATLNEIPSTSTQQQTLGASTTTSTTSSTSTAKDARLSDHRRSYKILSLAEQMQVIELRKTSDISLQKLATQFGCGTTQIQSILNKTTEIQMQFNVEENPQIIVSKRRSYFMTNLEQEELNNKLWEWYTRQKNNGIQVTNKMIIQEAQVIEPNFIASYRWLRKFKKQYNICQKNKAEDVNDDASREEKLTLSQAGSPRAHTVTQMCDSQQTVILPKSGKPLTSTVSFVANDITAMLAVLVELTNPDIQDHGALQENLQVLLLLNHHCI
jgi:hypothetical protein